MTGLGARRLQELGEQGEWQKILSLEIRVELACSENALPVRHARRIVDEASNAVELSPYSEHRVAIAKSVALGAINSYVRDVCVSSVHRWLPGRPPTQRARLLQSFENWSTADDLRETLLRAIQDEDHDCRSAAAHSLVSVFSSCPKLAEELETLARSNPRPEVRALALRTLAENPIWHGNATRACDSNGSSSSIDVAFSICAARVKRGVHEDHDLERLLRIWDNHTLDHILTGEFIDTLSSGWRQSMSIRKKFVNYLESESATMYQQIPLLYLIRCYPQDGEIAALLAKLFETHGLHHGHYGGFWRELTASFRGHPTVSPMVRQAIENEKKKSHSLLWHPFETPAYSFVGDTSARDELIRAYDSAADDAMGRYWIANTLTNGWPNDTQVVAALRTWASRDTESGAPLADWASTIHQRAVHRRAWLIRMVEEASARIVFRPIQALLDEFPDDESRVLIEDRCTDERIWYYNTVRIQSRLAREFPDRMSSQNTVARALTELDGPPLADLADAYQAHPRFRVELLRASVAATEDVRIGVASTLRDHAVDLRSVEDVTLHFLAENSPSARTASILARARLAKEDGTAAEKLAQLLSAEICSLGTFYGMRRLTALAGLLELGRGELAASLCAKHGETGLQKHLGIRYDYSAAIGAIIENWSSMQGHLENAGLDHKLPIKNLVESGYGSLLGKAKPALDDLDLYLRKSPNEGAPRIEKMRELAHRLPGSDALRSHLLDSLTQRSRGNTHEYEVAHLLVEHFREDSETASALVSLLSKQDHVARWLTPGSISILRLGWPSQDQRLKSFLPNDDLQNWMKSDRLLYAVSESDGETADRIATDLVSDTMLDWRYSVYHIMALRIWARQPVARSVLKRWYESENGSLATTSISLLSESSPGEIIKAVDVIGRINQEAKAHAVTPIDGMDVTTGTVTSWRVRAISMARKSV